MLKSIKEWLAVMAAAYVTWHLGRFFADQLAWWLWGWDVAWQSAPTPGIVSLTWYAAFPALFMAVLLPVAAALEATENAGSGIWTTAIVRRLTGVLAELAVVIPAGVAALFLVLVIGGINPFPVRSIAFNAYGVIAAVIIFGLALYSLDWLKAVIGRITRPVRHFLRARFFGMGGSAEFSGLLDEWASQWKPGQILLGASLYDPAMRIGFDDDRHVITLATSRSGKGRSAIIPNLLTWPGSAVVIDPKGENAAITATRRGKSGGRVKTGMGQAVYVLDPFGETAGLEGMPAPACFNPLAELDPKDPEIVEKINLIVESLIIPAKSGDPFWHESASALLAGMLAHLITTLRPEKRTLGNLRDMLKMPQIELVGMMEENRGGAGLPGQAAALLKNAGDRTGGNIVSTAMSQTAWLDSLAIRDCLSRSDFSLRELKANKTSVYLVLPFAYMRFHARFLRLFVNLAIREIGRGKAAKPPILFVLDEFYNLGPMPVLTEGAAQLTGYGIKLWPIVQNLTQLQEHYPDNWETFLGNAGTWQVFAVNDATTARYVSQRLGNHIVWQKVKTENGETEWQPRSIAPLRDPQEVARESSRDSGNQVIFREGGQNFLLRRLPYDKAFSKAEYARNPISEGRGESHRPPPEAEAAGEIAAAFDPSERKQEQAPKGRRGRTAKTTEKAADKKAPEIER